MNPSEHSPENDAHGILDLRGLKCPLPALFARRALARACPGSTVVVITDDPMAPIDVPHMCHEEGYEVIAVEAEDGSARLTLGRR
ncbi:MAG TPA: sulfurtransferase TusA family protein [Rhizomicrobium sp.]|nr:sulfurtransferase TusA family protein [Rhizomicrobium sp.]